jgi:hypothetical protein
MILGTGRLREAAWTPEKGAGGAGYRLPGVGKQQKPAIAIAIRKSLIYSETQKIGCKKREFY